jgi:hypothetical protein
LKLYGLDIQVAEDNKSLFFADAASGKRLLTLPAPFMYDAASNRSDLVSYEIIETQADIYSLRVVADAEWIESAVLPVAIDPTIMIAAEGASIEGEMNDIEIHGFSFDFNNGREVLLGAGDEYSVKIDINLETMLGNAFDVQTRFQNAELRLYQIPSYDSPEKQRFDVYIQVDPAYDVHANWETAKKIDCFERSMNDEGIIIINVTDEVNELFLNGFGQNGHIYIKLQIADNYDGIISLTTEGYYEDIIRPNFIFAYGSARDANPNEAYLNSKAGGAGKGGVNLANGNVLFSHNDTVSDGALTPVVVRHVYDNMSGGYDYAANKKGNSVEVLTDSYGMGKGWKLNIQHESRRI